MKLDDLKNFSLTEEQQKMLALGLVVLLGGGYCYINMLYKPSLAKITELRKELTEEEDFLSEMEDSTRNIAKFRRESEEIIRDLRRIRRRLPDQANVPEAMRGVNKAVKMSGVTLSKFFKPPSPKGRGATGGPNYSALSTEILIVTDYRGLATFITELMRIPRLITLHQIQLTRSGDSRTPGSLKAKIGIKTYIYTGGAKDSGKGGKRKRKKRKK